MENIRFGLLCAIGVLCFFLYQAWQTDYAPTQADATSANGQTAGQNDYASADEDDVPSLSSAPESDGGPEQSSDSRQAQTGQDDEPVVGEADQIHVVTDRLDVIIDTRGGDLRKVELRGVPVSSEKPDTNLRLINDSAPNFFITQSGLVADGAKAPDHRSTYQAERKEYELEDGQDTLEVPLTWTNQAGHEVTKVYTFHRDSYRIGLNHRVTNNGDSPWRLSQYVRFWRTPYEITGDVPFAQAFFGVGWYDRKDDGDSYSYRTESHEDLAENPLELTQQGGWVAMIQHYFIGAAIPPPDSKARFFGQPKDVPNAAGGFATGFIGAQQQVAAGSQADFESTLFVGPKLQDQLESVAPGLGLTVDYGWLTVLAKPIFWVLEHLHALVGNWGVAIILLTFLIKLVFYKLSETQYRAMARMRKFAPRMQQLKEQYGDDRQKLQSKMMELYKKEGFNPLAGCWPMLVQMPVFISLYWVLRESVELRHAPFMLWIQDLSAPDPYYILPVVFGVTMFLQQKLTANVTMDPMQQRIMQIMPVGLAVFFAFFPAGLVLYWCTNNLLSIGQQWYIYRKLDAEGLGHKAASS
ncbi:membrane protein insertase YidC [Salinisphaera sp.]|uniref:membrane protein insertase YidC n=1 Tax=Salinisphaera sp. TaxID=1914330 RepID=UPI000C5411C7|nr:membrane protein insertase YidC [Salinisphaera sp.]MAS09380.1 membrane protein insertase YidC [Salinisphaera sp.]